MYKINPKILQTPISDGKVLLLEPSKGLYFELNEVSVLIYQCINEGKNNSETIEKVTQYFNVEKEVTKADLTELIQQLIDNNIIHQII